MSGGSTVHHIDAVDTLARTLYLRAKQSGLPFTDVANAVRNLHLALRHLRIEAADQDSVLNNAHASSSSLYARQLAPLVQDCDFTLAQLESLLDKYGDGRAVMPEDERLRDDRISVMKQKLVSDKTSVDLFLDAVQLHAENRPTEVVQGQEGLENIKDVVDKIATNLFRNRSESSFTEDEDDMWRGFKTELEKEGFSPQVLRKHKHQDVLRAYIRELESVQNQYGGNYPTVRGLLEHEAKSQPASPRELDSSPYNKYPPVIITGGRRRANSDTVRDANSSSPREGDGESDYSMALVSTQDLIAMDNLNSRMANLNVQPTDQYSLSPGQKYLSSNTAGTLPDVPEMSASPTAHHYETSPRSMPPMPSHLNGSGPPSYGSSPRSSASRLAPDRWGNEIPPDAQWTRIRRELVSPEVLERAGVRYEARPDYVAILGRLSREQVTAFARESAACRAARSRRGPPPRRHNHHAERRDSKSSHDDDDDSEVFDDTDATGEDDDKASDKGTRSYPFIVNPPTKDKTSPSSTTLPKPILKNRNENHVRFDPEPYEVDGRSPRSFRDDRDRDRDHRRERRHLSPPRSSRRPRRYSDSGDRHSRSDKHGDYYYDSGKRYHRERDRDRDRDRDRERDRERDRDRRSTRRDDRPQGRKKWGEALGAVGIGGAAVSLLSVLAEAAS
ncbi:hypothetical protein F66182_9938 [Fusarium sp. NRRL 66182]|nr:hypothetical protein F66182_9938 [Fusarium sp. NRRL 66182]